MTFVQGRADMSVMEKLRILADAAKYDVACTSSGVARGNSGNGIGNCMEAGICHSFAADGRCISLLKILFMVKRHISVLPVYLLYIKQLID